MIIEKVIEKEQGYIVNDSIYIPKADGNSDYKALLNWVEEGGVVEQYIEPTESIESKLNNLYIACENYQKGCARPRIDSNFYALIVTFYGDETKPKCNANLIWLDALWNDYESRKQPIINGEEPNYDFSNNGNPPYKFDECRAELV